MEVKPVDEKNVTNLMADVILGNIKKEEYTDKDGEISDEKIDQVLDQYFGLGFELNGLLF